MMAPLPGMVELVVNNDPDNPCPPRGVELGGGVPHDPDMETRVAVLEEIAKSVNGNLAELKAGQEKLSAKIEAGLEKMRDTHDRDFRITFGALIAVALGLAGLMAKGFHWF